MPDMAKTAPELLQKKDFTVLVDAMLRDAASGDGGRLALTDTQEGSALRTLVEVFAREMAVAYEQLDLVQDNAWLATARGPALDRVVDLLGIRRHRPGHLRGTVVFSRSTPALEDIPIPAGTVVAGRDACPCATVRQVILKKGDMQVEAEVRALEPAVASAEEERFGPGCLHTLPRPVSGIEQVGNQAELLPAAQAETDAELRDRVRRVVRTSGAGTALSLQEAVRSLGVEQVRVLERPGRIKVVVGCVSPVMPDTVGANPCVHPCIPDRQGDLLTRVEERIQQVRPAGIQVEIVPAKPVGLEIYAALTLKEKLSVREQQALEERLKKRLREYFTRMQIGEPVYEEKIRSLLLSENGVIRCVSLPNRHSLLRPVSVLEEHRCNSCHEHHEQRYHDQGCHERSRDCRVDEGREGDVFPDPDERAELREEAVGRSAG